jgi:pyruvate formate-lyase/glycerol dehydratase family glycyl radical enzyme
MKDQLSDPAPAAFKGSNLKAFTALGSIGPLPRLESLRNDILASPYHVCTQKASLLTAYFRSNIKQDILDWAVSRLQYPFYRRSLHKSAGSIPQKSWQVNLNNKLNSWLATRRAVSNRDYVLHYARAIAYILENMDLRVYDHELICGNPSAWRVGAPIHPDLGGLLMLPEIRDINNRKQNPMDIEKSQIAELVNKIFPYWFNRSVLALTPLYSNNPSLFNTMLAGQYFILTQFSGISHVTPDYPVVLKLGFNGIKQEIQHKIEEVREELASATKKKTINLLEDQLAFLQAGMICTEAAIGYGKRWSIYLQQAAEKENDEVRKKELLKLADIFTRVPAGPASSLYEALQSVFITHVILHYENFQHGISFGRMDQYLYPFYKRDIDNGTITEQEAAELIGCFLCKAGELLPLFFDRATEYFSGLSSASGITLGGATVDGKDAVNELSYLFLLAYDQVRLRQPNFHVRVNDSTAEEFMELCYRVLERGGGLPAFFNDVEIVRALENTGVTRQDAEDYSVVGCVEWGCPGKSFPAAGAAFINLPAALQLALHNGFIGTDKYGPQTGDIFKFKSMEDLITAFKVQLHHLIEEATEGNNAIEQTHARYRPTPFLSIVVDGCITSGREINAGGAKYNSTGCQGVGLADVVDSLTAIEQLVYKSGKISLQNLVSAVDRNFQDRPDLRAFILNRIPKYGQNDDRTNYFSQLVSLMYEEEVSTSMNTRGGRYAPGFWSMTTHQGFGTRTGALPGGRLSGAPLANGVSPANGRDINGPTASLSSASNLFNISIANGYALNQKLDLIMMKKPGSHALMNGLIRGFFTAGGMQVQFNIIDPNMLMEARRMPDQYRALVVRVSGYSAYFNDLTEQVKDELIERTLHDFTSCIC